MLFPSGFPSSSLFLGVYQVPSVSFSQMFVVAKAPDLQRTCSWKNVLIDFAFDLFISFVLTTFQMLDKNTDFNLWFNYRPTVM